MRSSPTWVRSASFPSPVPRVPARLRRSGPEIAFALVVGFAAVSLWQAWVTSRHLRTQARETSRIYGRITAALADSTAEVGTDVLFSLVGDIIATGIPMVVTDDSGRVTDTRNLHVDRETDSAELQRSIRAFDRINPPIALSIGTLHFGELPMARRLRWLELFQLGLLVTALAVGAWAYRSAVARHRERMWVVVARESAHQLGTPLMSIGAWVDRLEDGATGPAEIARHLRGDLERLERVAKRFERIGRPAQRDRVALGAMAERVATYFTPRLPKHAEEIRIAVDAPDAGPHVPGDPVLLEWALEALVRNAVDALSGRGGTVRLSVRASGNRVHLQVADNGPGIPVEIRSSLFEPGVTTKPGGWGIGLALARRIIEDVHGGRLSLQPSGPGAVFQVDLPLVESGTRA
jgi:signal transduction histidine kinase